MSYRRIPGRGINPYLDLLEHHLSEQVEALEWSWATALLLDYDVLHVHWPEQLYRGRFRLVSALKFLGAFLIVLEATLWRRAIVRTVHNERPHESAGWIEGKFLRYLDWATDYRILLAPSNESYRGLQRVIPHGPYLGVTNPPQEDRLRDIDRGTILFFGAIRPYKGLEELIDVFVSLHDEEKRLRILGEPNSEAIADLVRQAAVRDIRISHDLRYIPESELETAIRRAHIIVLPYREFGNSGSAMLSLSLARPVFVPRCAATELLQEEFGCTLVHLYDRLTGEALAETLNVVPAQPLHAPSFEARSWETAGREHSEIYRGCAKLRGGRRGARRK